MKKCLMVFAMILALAGFAAASDVDDVNAATEALRKAMLNADRAELEKYVLPELIYVHSAGKVENAKQFIDAIAPGPDQIDTYYEMEFNNQKVATNGSMAIVTHIFDGKSATKGKEPGIIHIGVTQVWKKDGDTWRLLARKASVLPF